MVRESKRLLKKGGYIVIVDFCFSEANVDHYYCSLLNRVNCAFFWPEWSDIPYVHHTPKSMCEIFNPITHIMNMPLDLVSCNGHISMGYLSILKIGE